jgi:hypothetical protein
MQAEGNTLCYESHKLINSIWNKGECHSSGRNLLLYLFVKRVIKLSSNYRRISVIGYTQNFIHYSCLKVKLVGMISVGYDMVDQLLVR